MALRVTFMLASTGYTSMGSSVARGCWAWYCHFPRFRLELTTLRNSFLVNVKDFAELCLGLGEKL